MLIDYYDRNFMRGCIPYTTVDRVVEEMDGLGSIVTTKDKIKTSLEYSSLRRVYEDAIIADMEMLVDMDEEDDDGV